MVVTVCCSYDKDCRCGCLQMEVAPESSKGNEARERDSNVLASEVPQSTDDVAQLLEALSTDTQEAAGLSSNSGSDSGGSFSGRRNASSGSNSNGTADPKVVKQKLRAASQAAEKAKTAVFAHPTGGPMLTCKRS